MTVSAVVVARDEAAMLPGCLRRLQFADEVVVVIDDRSSDDSEELARQAGAKVYRRGFDNFSDLKNYGLEQASGEWVLVIDADERVSTALREEILQAVSRGAHDAFVIPFDSYFFGQQMRHGGWGEDEHIRLFRRGSAKYQGDIHEQLVFADGCTIGRLINPVAHFSHRSIKHNGWKTLHYADVQAAELLGQGYPEVRARTLFRVILREFYQRMIRGRAYKDGMPGVIEALYQPFSLFVVYVRLWELQRQPSLEDRYRALEEQIS